MRIVVLTESWPGDGLVPLSSRETADAVAEAWAQVAPQATVRAFPIGDGGPRSADALQGRRLPVGGAEVVEVSGTFVLVPAGGATRWEPHGLATALLGLAAAYAHVQPPRSVIVPVADRTPAGNATDLWLGGFESMREGIAALDLVVAVSSQRPLLGFNGMSSALRDGRETDQAIGRAAQAQEERWAAIARDVDPIASVPSLLGSTRLSDMPGTGAAGGLAYALAAVGGRIRQSAPLIAELIGAAAEAERADLLVAVVPELVPRTLDEGTVPAAASLAGSRGVPAIVVAPGASIGRRDQMNAGLSAAHQGEPGAAGLAAAVRRVAQTWTPQR